MTVTPALLWWSLFCAVASSISAVIIYRLKGSLAIRHTVIVTLLWIATLFLLLVKLTAGDGQ